MMAKHWPGGLILLLLSLAVMHLPTLSLERIRDDHYVLELCRTISWSRLLVDGFRFPREDFGNPWWISHEEICHFFRPLVLASFKLPIALFGPCDFLHRVGNLFLHMLASLGLYFVLRRLCRSSRAALLGTAFWAFSYLNQWAVMWIVARKELMVGAFLLWAFWAHLAHRPGLRLLLALGAMFSGEHGAAFPLLVVAWDLLAPMEATGLPFSFALAHERFRRHLSSWLPLFLALGAYLCIRTLALGGLRIPPPPYFWPPDVLASWGFYAMKILLWATSLAWHNFFMDRPFFTLWLDHPWTALLMALGTLAILRWAHGLSRHPRLFSTALLMSFLVFLPFLPLPAMPIYLYSPLAFFALAVATALDGAIEAGEGGKAFRRALAALVLLNLLASMIWTWSGWMQRFAYPVEVLPKVRALVADVDPRRPILLVDCSPHAMSLPWLLARDTGRPSARVAVLTMCDHWKHEAGPTLSWRKDGSLVVENREHPWWGTVTERKLSFFNEGLVRRGATLAGPWFDVTLEELAPEAPLEARGRRFYSTEPGVVRMGVRFREGERPVVILFLEGKPLRLRRGGS